jgi:ABC-type sulfate transport system permease component
MLKFLAVVRTIFLVFIIGYTVYAMAGPWADVARTFDEQYARCAAGLTQLRNAAWLAIAWILLETILGWFVATRQRPARKLTGTDLPSGEPPFAPPPRR